MRARWPKKAVTLVIAAIAAALLLGSPALGQCSMCRASLASSNNAFIRNWNIGVLVLLIPPATIFCSIFVALKRYKASDNNESSVSPDSGVTADCELQTPDS
jgi:hypothetical protein